MGHNKEQMPAGLPRKRFIAGAAVFFTGQAIALLVVLIPALDIPAGVKATLSALVFFVIPSIFTFSAVAILGRPGFEYLKRLIFHWFRRYGPPEVVGATRYRIGLVMFIMPIVLGWLLPYVGHLIPGYEIRRIVCATVVNVIFLASFFVLGGEFWDKVRSLFIYRARAQFPANRNANAQGGTA